MTDISREALKKAIGVGETRLRMNPVIDIAHALRDRVDESEEDHAIIRNFLEDQTIKRPIGRMIATVKLLRDRVDELEKVKDGYALLMGDMPSRVDLRDRVDELEEVLRGLIRMGTAYMAYHNEKFDTTAVGITPELRKAEAVLNGPV